jgi:hypothetical protein
MMLRMTRDPFRFLSTVEFQSLTVPEKVTYLQRALEAIKMLHGKPAKGERRKQKRK